MDLPVIGEQPSERADAALNRTRILEAAKKLFGERGISCTTMDAIASEAGVGKGTLFRRFGDRATLALAVLDDSERELQDELLRGTPPLGPGAPPRERIVAFGEAMLDALELNSEILLEAERLGGLIDSAPRRVHRLHLRNLLAEADPDGDTDYLVDVLLGPLSPSIFIFERELAEMDLDRLKAGYADLVDRVLR